MGPWRGLFVFTVAWMSGSSTSSSSQYFAAATRVGNCEECHAVMRRPDQSDYLGGASMNLVSASLLDRRLQCQPKEEVMVPVVDTATNAMWKGNEEFCSKNCRAEPPRKQEGQEVACVTESKPRKLSLAQLSTAYALTGCPEPKPCLCNCWCDPIMYGTPMPLPPTPFATGAPPVLSLLETRSETKAKTKAVLAVSSSEDPRPIVLGPMAPPLPPLPPPPDRSFCPKAAACNCFCPCRE